MYRVKPSKGTRVITRYFDRQANLPCLHMALTLPLKE